MTVQVNGSARELADGTTGAQLLAELGAVPSITVAEVNGRIVPRAEFGALMLHDGDVLELVTIVGGG